MTGYLWGNHVRRIHATSKVLASWLGESYSWKWGKMTRNYKSKSPRIRQHTLNFSVNDLHGCHTAEPDHLTKSSKLNAQSLSLYFLSLPKIVLGRSLFCLYNSYILHEIPYATLLSASNKTFPCDEASLAWWGKEKAKGINNLAEDLWKQEAARKSLKRGLGSRRQLELG